MAKRMHLYKSYRFEILAPIPDLDPDYSNYPDSAGNLNTYLKKMKAVADSGSHSSGLGKWFAARCVTAPSIDDSGQVENIYAVYFALDTHGDPIVSTNIPAAAPCPPFCVDDFAE